MYFDAHTHLNDPKIVDNWEDYFQKFIQMGGVGLEPTQAYLASFI